MDNDTNLVTYDLQELAINSPANRHIFQPVSYATSLFGQSGIYRSYFRHSVKLTQYAEAQKVLTGKPDIRGYQGSVAADSIIIDLDSKQDVELARQAAIRLLTRLHNDYTIDLNASSICFSGRKGFHVEIPATLFGGFTPAAELPGLHKLIVEHLTEGFGNLIDTSIYRHTGLIRLENTKHQDTGLFSIPILFNELTECTMDQIRDMAVRPRIIERIDPGTLATNAALEALKAIRPKVSTESVVGPNNNESVSAIVPPSIDKWPKIAKHCRIIRAIERKHDAGDNIVHQERVWLGTIATAFGEPGKRKVHELLAGQANYDQTKTEGYLNQMTEHGYKPALCANICGPDNLCPAIKTIRRRSPSAFAYTDGEKAYVESYAVERLVKHFGNLIYVVIEKSFYEYSSGVYKPIDEQELKTNICQLLPFYFSVKDITNNRLNALVERMKLERAVRFEEKMNADMYRLNLANGIYDLRTGILSDHTPEFKSSIQLPFSYDSKATCPLFDQFMLDTFKGDQDTIDYMLKLWCYLFMPTYAFQKIWVWIGEGRNGKGVLSRLVIRTLGQTNVSHEDLHQLAHERFSAINLMNKQANFSTELRADDLDMTAIKKLSGEDFVSAEFKGKDKINFKNYARLIVSGNKLPRFSEIGTAIMERFVFIPFRNVVLADAVDTTLEENLSKELPGIFNRVASMFPQIQDPNGTIYFKESEAITAARETMLSSVNSAVEFINTECRRVPGSQSTLKGLYPHYQTWCKESGYNAMGKNKFADALRSGCKLAVTNGTGNQTMIYGVEKNYAY